MASNRNVTQQVSNISIPRNGLMRISENENLSKKDLRVLLFLLTQLEGYSVPKNNKTADPYNYRKIEIGSISSILNMKKKDVKESIERLCNESIIEVGSALLFTGEGFRFTF